MNNDCLLSVFLYLKVGDVCSLSSVNKQWYLVSNNKSMWKQLFDQNFDNIIIGNQSKLKYKEFNILNTFLIKSQIGSANVIYNLRIFRLHRYSGSIPPEIGLLTNLEELYLYNNWIKSIPSEIGLLTNLQKLNLNNNLLEYLPPEIKCLTRLRKLELTNNLLERFPPGIKFLTRLEELYLHNNKLKSIPSEIGLLTNLRNLLLHKNRLKSIPSEIGQLTRLRSLLLDNNHLDDIQFQYIPDNIKHVIIAL